MSDSATDRERQLRADFLQGMLDREIDVLVYRSDVPMIKGQTVKPFVPANWDNRKKMFIHDSHCEVPPHIFIELIKAGELVDLPLSPKGCQLYAHHKRVIRSAGLCGGIAPKIDLRGNRARLDHVNHALSEYGCKVVRERTIKAFRVVMNSGQYLAKPYIAGAYTIRDYNEDVFIEMVLDVLRLNGIEVNE